MQTAEQWQCTEGIPDCGDKLVHEVQVGLVWYIALSAENLVVGTLHQLLFQFCSMLDVRFLLRLQAAHKTAAAQWGTGNNFEFIWVPVAVSVPVRCGTLQFCSALGGAADSDL